MQYLILAIIMVIGWVIPAAAQEAAPAVTKSSVVKEFELAVEMQRLSSKSEELGSKMAREGDANLGEVLKVSKDNTDAERPQLYGQQRAKQWLLNIAERDDKELQDNWFFGGTGEHLHSKVLGTVYANIWKTLGTVGAEKGKCAVYMVYVKGLFGKSVYQKLFNSNLLLDNGYGIGNLESQREKVRLLAVPENAVLQLREDGWLTNNLLLEIKETKDGEKINNPGELEIVKLGYNDCDYHREVNF